MNKNHLSTSFATAIGAAAKALARVTGALALIAVALFATNASADRTITVTSLSGDNATLDFGATDGNAYTLAWGYGDEDGGSATNAWDNFAILGTVAAGDTTRTVALPAGWANTVTHLRFFLLAPETYPYATRLEYIESTGSQWIDTQVRGRVGVTAEVDIICTSMGDQAILASRKDDGDTRFTVIHWNAYDLICGLGGHGYWYWAQRHVIEVDDRHVIRAVMANGNQSVTIDGNTIGTPRTNSSSFDSGYSMYLLAVHKGSSAIYPAHAKLYSAKIWLDGNLERDFVPCRDSNNEVCLYDLVSGEYFRNIGSGTFTAGQEIAPGLEVTASSALCEPPARSIAIASKNASTVTLAIGPANGNTYTLCMAYGAADGGTSPSGWDEFEELGEIDSGDNDYDANLPAGWGDTVMALRFFLLRPDNTVASRTETLIYVNELIVEAGAPTSNGSDAEYDIVRLRDTLRLRGGTLTSTVVVVDGPAGNLDIDGGNLSSSSRLSLDPALETENEYATLLVLRQGATTLEHATNANTNVAARIHFLGGYLRCTGFDGKPLCSASGGKWILEGTSSHPIRFGDLGQQRMDWLTGDGSIETRGYCDVVFDDSSYNAEHDYRGTIWLNTSNTVWNHTGNLVLSNAIDVICRADDCLPAGPQTGIVRMKWVNRGLPAPLLDLNGHSVAVNGINTIAGGIVTNSARAAAALRVGEGNSSGQVSLPPLAGGNIGFAKSGAGTNTVSLGSSSIAGLSVDEGTLVVMGSSSDVLEASSVSVAPGARLVVNGLTINTPSLDASGLIEYAGDGNITVPEGRPSWFSATASTDATTGGSWLSKPAIAGGAYVIQGGAAVFSANEGRIDFPRVEATIHQDYAWPVDMLDDFLADAVARGARARFAAVCEADGETLSWRGLVLDGGAAAWKTLLGVPVATDADCRVAAEFDFSGETPLVSYLVASGGADLSRLHDALGATWFPAAGSGAGLAGRVEISGSGDLYELTGTAKTDRLPPPPPPPSPVTVFFIQ